MPRGGTRRNSGAKASPSARQHSIRVYMSIADHDVVEQLAGQWDVPKATAAYALFATAMRAIVRRTSVGALPQNVVLAASKMVVASNKSAGASVTAL